LLTGGCPKGYGGSIPSLSAIATVKRTSALPTAAPPRVVWWGGPFAHPTYPSRCVSCPTPSPHLLVNGSLGVSGRPARLSSMGTRPSSVPTITPLLTLCQPPIHTPVTVDTYTTYSGLSHRTHYTLLAPLATSPLFFLLTHSHGGWYPLTAREPEGVEEGSLHWPNRVATVQGPPI
jgi:hypothetical protein